MRKTFSKGAVVVLQSEAWLWNTLAIPPRVLTVSQGNDTQENTSSVVTCIHFDSHGNLQTNIYKVDVLEAVESLNKFADGWPSRPC